MTILFNVRYIFYCFLFFFVPLYGYQTEDVHLIIARAAEEQVGVTISYAPGYIRISYPGGDIPLEKGVCTDVVIRAFREIGIDLQKEVHEDMAGHFKEYPKFWKLKAPDTNIDHRRVPNLMKFFQRRGKSMRIGSEYKSGDIIAWQLDQGLFHIGIVSTEIVQGTKRYYMIHNIGAGAEKEDMLNDFKIIGHYRW